MTSKTSLARLRMRTAAYRVKFSRTPSALELMSLALALVGAWTVIQFILSLVGDNPWLFAIAVLLLIGLFATLLARRHILDYSSLFERAATNIELARRLHDDCALGMKNQDAWDLLGRIYLPMIAQVNSCAESPHGVLHYLLDANGRPFLCAVLAAPPGARLSTLLHPDLVRSNVDLGAASFAEARQAYIRRLRSTSTFSNPLGDEEGDNLVLTRLSCNAEEFLVSCSVATYGEIVRTSDSLQNEFAVFGFLSAGYGLRRRRKPFPRSTSRATREPRSLTFTTKDGLKLLPWRRQVHEWSGSPSRLFFAPRGRASGLGVSVAMVSGEQDGESAYTALRAANVGVYPGALHVVPSGMCNTRIDLRTGARKLPEDYIKWVMLAELLEECFDLQELAEARTFDWIAATERALRERGIGSFEPTLTGLALDLLNLRWDVCARVDMGVGHQRDDYRLCWEYAPLQQVRTQRLGRVGAELDRRDMVQAGAGSLALAQTGQPLLKRVGDNA